MPAREYAVEGDRGFIGLNSRDNPVNLAETFVAKSQNFRFNRGVATVRKGIERLTPISLVGVAIFGSCAYTQADGTELIILVVGDGLYAYNPDTEALSVKVSFPGAETIVAADEVDVYQAQSTGYVYICRGFSKSTLRWNGAYTAGSIVIPGPGAHNNYQNSRHALYYGNRHIVQTDGNTFQVSHYLSDSNWSALDKFSINDGGNDRLVALAPWTLNEFVVFMRNSVFYAAVGVGGDTAGHAATNSDSYVKSLVSDIGCIANGSVVQAAGGILFLSDNGVYFLQPAGVAAGQGTTPEGMRLLTLAEPLSAPIDDVIQRINYNYVSRAVAAYWENRYYIAVPVDSSTTNNVLLVYNFVNKAWESVDTYPSGFDVKYLVTAKKGTRRRLFAIDGEQGVFLLEELEYDEYGAATGTPILPFYLPAVLNSSTFTPYQISGEIVSRAYKMGTSREKRYSDVTVDLSCPAAGQVAVSVVTTNPDVTTNLVNYGSSSDEDVSIRCPARKRGYYAQVKVTTSNLRPSVRSCSVEAVIPGKNTKSTE